MNRVNIIGNIATDIKLQYSKDGNPWCSFNLGYSMPKNGGKQSCYVGIIAFGALAENTSKYCSKGRPVAVDGQLEVINERLPDGTYNTRTHIIAYSIDFLNPAPKQSNNNPM